jgi:hypothetical protein
MVETYERTEPLPVKVDPGAWAHLRSDEVRSRYYDMMRPSTFVDGSGHLEIFMRERDLLVLPPDPLTGLRILNKEIYGAFDYVPGFTAADSPIDAALEHRKGVCQDFAHIMLAVARHWGVPSRYVSGYLARTEQDTQIRSIPDASHAWIQVYYPGIGWFDFDPTNNLRPSDQHIIIGWGRDYDDVSPVKGVILGGENHTITVGVSVIGAE